MTVDKPIQIAYLASPYSHPSPSVQLSRYRKACQVAANLMRKGIYVYSPIVYGYPLTRYGVPGDWDFWAEYDEAMLRRCDELIVLMLDGWDESKGVQREIEIARKIGIPVKYIRYSDWSDADGDQQS